MNNNSANVFLNAAGKLISTLNLFFVITKTCNQICLFHSLLLIHILDQKYLDGKPVIDRNVISIPKAPAQLITVPPNLLDAVQCEKKKNIVCVFVSALVRICVCVCPGEAMCSTVAECNPWPLPAALRSFK